MKIKRNDTLEDLLQNALYTKQRPDTALHEEILNHWKEDIGKKMNGKYKDKLYPAAAMLCLMLIFLGSTAAYVTANDLNIGKLFQKMWSGYEKLVVEKHSEDITIIKEKNTSKNLEIEPVQIISDGLSTYLVLRVTGKNGLQLTDDMVVSDNYTIMDDEESWGIFSTYFLKKEGNTIYYAFHMKSMERALKKSTVTFSIKNVYLVYGGYDETGWINQTSDDPVCEGKYSATLQGKVNSDKVSMKIDGATYDIYAMGIHVNRDLGDKLDNPNGKYYWDTNAAVVLKDGTEVAISADVTGSGREASFTECSLLKPVDLEQVKGIRIGKKVYDLK